MGERGRLLRTLTLSSGDTISYLGPPIDVGPLPALLYFTMSHRDSLMQDPYNQVLIPLHGAPLRIFSWDLPYHPVGIDQNRGIKAWEEAEEKEGDFLAPFISHSLAVLKELSDREILIPGAVIASGLSRGAFAAFKLASASNLVSGVMAFAPLVHFYSLTLEETVSALASKWVRGFIGFQDERVHTEKVVEFFGKLTLEARKDRSLKPDIQLTLYPSLGFKGHGTPEEIFVAGGQAILKRLSS